MKRTASLILALSLVLLNLLSSCGETAPAADTTAPDAETTVPGEDDGFVKSDLPALDYGGAEFRILVGDVHGGTTFPTYFVEEATGDIVDDAIYQRNAAVEERLNVKLAWDRFDFDYGTRNDYVTRITAAVMSGDGSCDLICGPGYYTTNLVVNDYFVDLETLPYLDFDKPWWSGMYMENAKINGRLYSALGDLSLNKFTLAYVMYFNKDLFDARKLAYPYADVLAGKWTLDALEKLITDTWTDVNGDGTRDKNDGYGLTSENNNNLWAFMDSSDVYLFKKDSSGKVGFTMDNEHNANVVERLSKLFGENDNVLKYNEPDGNTSPNFMMGHSYLATGQIGFTNSYRDLDFEYGILPYPKYDLSQEGYATRTSSAISVFFVPVSATDPERSAAVLEAMNDESCRTVIPAYYETALKVKYVRDDESVQVLDMVREGITMQFVDIFSTVFSGYSEIFRTVVAGNKGTWVSEAAGIKTAAIEKLAGLIEYYEK